MVEYFLFRGCASVSLLLNEFHLLEPDVTMKCEQQFLLFIFLFA